MTAAELQVYMCCKCLLLHHGCLALYVACIGSEMQGAYSLTESGGCKKGVSTNAGCLRQRSAASTVILQDILLHQTLLTLKTSAQHSHRYSTLLGWHSMPHVTRTMWHLFMARLHGPGASACTASERC
jgi:hypothetical protein